MSGEITTPSYQEPVALYRHYDSDGRLLYIGQSANPIRRIISHRHSGSWVHMISTITIEWLPNRAEAIVAERSAIASEKPPFNVIDRPPNHQDRWPSPLGQYLMQNGISAARFADHINVGNSTVLRWCRGIKRPGEQNRAIIEKVTNGHVPSGVWGAPS